eukprot:s878_g5.t1
MSLQKRRKDRIKLVEKEAHVSFDPDATSKLKSACEMQSFVNDLMVFRASSQAEASSLIALEVQKAEDLEIAMSPGHERKMQK